jgi:NAD(P)-dependent dehydrogenase (short-subunit alcohol dehydrogenase family)
MNGHFLPDYRNTLFDLHDKTALITGASRGLGLAIASALGQAGASLVISSESSADCLAAEAKLRGQGLDVMPIVCDVAERSQVERLVAQAAQRLGGIDILVCNAGIPGPYGALGLVSEADWDRTMTINLRSAWWLTSLVVPGMAERGGGVVLATASLSALRGNKAIGLYGISKAGLTQLVRNLAVEWGPSNIRVNAIAPGVIDTEFARPIIEDPEASERRKRLTPLRRFGTPEEIGGVALLLASAAGAFITGQTLVVDGGTTISDGN